MSFPEFGRKRAEVTSPRRSAAAFRMTTSRRPRRILETSTCPIRSHPCSAGPGRFWASSENSKLIESHYENNYGGAFARLNEISEELAALDPATTPPHVIRRLKQDEAAALNSLVLHELYFASLGGDGRAVPELMANAVARDFGSVDRWRSEFVALANSLDAGSGWVLLTWLPRAGRLINQCVCEGSQAIAGGI